MNVREVAADVLRRVWTDDAYAAAALSSALSRASLDERDRALATELLYGVLRTQGALVRLLSQHGKVKESDKILLSHLLIAAYQIEFLDRIPERAAVHEAVTLIKEVRGERVAGFANAVLRKLGRVPPEARLKFREAVLQSFPSWMKKRLVRDVGEEGAFSLLAPLSSPRPYLRVIDQAQLPWLEEKNNQV